MSWRAATLLALISWGALAFGAPYPWAFIPLYAGCALVGIAGCLSRQKTSRLDLPLAAALLGLAVAIAVQLVPLHESIIRSLSPETDLFLQRYVVGYATMAGRHPLSIEPSATLRALVATCAMTMLLLGSARSLRDTDALHFARGTAVLGAFMALAGIVQKAMWNGKIYGFWTPQTAGDSFGPFVNRNHFAGWMLMALPLVIGYFCSRIGRGMRGIKPGWQNRVIWFSSADASETILVGFAALLMALALVLTMSRSGAAGLLVALAVSGWFVTRQQSEGAKRATVVVYLVFVAFFVVWWAGLDRLAARFADASTVDAASRLGIWADTWRIAERFPLVGTGLNTFGTATIYFQTADLDRHYAQAHNDYLQLISEGGLLVCIPAVILAGIFVWRIRRRFHETSGNTDYWIRMGAVTGILAVALQETVDFSLQMPGNAALFVILLALAAYPPASGRSSADRPAAR
jgi:putative inorganic carbon (HCO3(-)) transporter